MATELEWSRRVAAWSNVLPKLFYRPLGTIELAGYTTADQLSATEAETGPFIPMPSGTPWGAKWEYAWFTTELTLPQEAQGQRIVLRAEPGAESTVYVNGRHAGAFDRQHREITLTMHGTPGATYRILIEAYGGHGATPTTAGPTPPDVQLISEPPATQKTVGVSTFGIWQEELYQLWVDVETLAQLREQLDTTSLRYAAVTEGLRDFTLIYDPELPLDEMLTTATQARARLQPLLACVNGSTAPDLYAFGHSHIDVAWLWPLAETERKCARTFGTALALMEEYPEYRFLQSQPHLYRMVKQLYPDLYERIKAAVANGTFIPEGAMWVEADTNISGGESLIRQCVHGKRFFRDEFGVECEMLWLPDVFGYSGALPQILRGCGVKYFSTAKIYWNYHGGDPFPYTTFTWEGIDGSEVLTSLCTDYNSETTPAALTARWKERPQTYGISSRLVPFGWGDGGGGATRDHLEFLRRQSDLEGIPRTHIDTPNAFFHDLEQRGVPDARYVGELYFQAHRGVYTTQARTKRGNRKSEFALREAELWGAAAQHLAGFAYPLAVLDEAWKQVLLNQFHDIIPGSSIKRVFEEAEAGYADVIETAEEAADRAIYALVQDTSDAMTVFNSLSWPRTALVALPEGVAGATTESGQRLPVQEVEGERLVAVHIPACGWTTVHPAEDGIAVPNTLVADDHLLENEYLRLEFNDRGEITRIHDKELGLELAAGPCNAFRMYKDVPTWYDAWDIDSQYMLTPVELPETATMELVTAGPLVATLRVTRQLHHSRMTQEISLRHGSRRVDFVTRIDWQERHKLLKVAFPVHIHANEAIHEIQFGHIRRPNHTSRQFDADRFEVTNHKWTALAEEHRGCAVLNDSKYGVNVLGNSINLTLLRSPIAPDMTADLGMQEFTYAFYAWDGSLAESNVVREGYELNVPVTAVSGAAGERSLFTVNAANVIIDTVKSAEDGSGDVVVRLYEAKRCATRCALSTTLPVQTVAETNMLEEDGTPVALNGNTVSLTFHPFEVKTLRMTL